MSLSNKQVEQYLNKLHYTDKLDNSGATLEKLQLANLKYIPYENFDILNSKPLSLKIDDLFDKLILNNRGGYCFETNGLYCALLESLGFKITSYTGRYIPNETHLQMRRHRILKVEASDGVYICDVGVRVELPRKALKLILDEVQNDGVSDYKFTWDDFYGYVLWQKPQDKQWKKIYGFTKEPQAELDYIMPSFFCEKHPDSPFIKTLYAAIYIDDAHLTLTNNVYKVYKQGKVVEYKIIDTKEKLLEVIRHTFKIEIEDINLDNIEYTKNG